MKNNESKLKIYTNEKNNEIFFRSYQRKKRKKNWNKHWSIDNIVDIMKCKFYIFEKKNKDENTLYLSENWKNRMIENDKIKNDNLDDFETLYKNWYYWKFYDMIVLINLIIFEIVYFVLFLTVSLNFRNFSIINKTIYKEIFHVKYITNYQLNKKKSINQINVIERQLYWKT